MTMIDCGNDIQTLRTANAALKERIETLEARLREKENGTPSEALLKSEEKFSLAFQTSPYAITITRARDGKLVDVNDAFTSISGFTREEALAATTTELNLWVDEKDRKWVVSTLLEGKSVTGREFLFQVKGGEIITGLFSARIMNLNGEAHILSSINDITKYKRTTEALRESDKRLRTIVDVLPQMVAYIDTDLRYRFVNKAFQDMFDVEPEEVIGKTIPEIIGEETFEKARIYIEKVLQGNRVRYYERYEYRPGRLYDIDGVLIPDFDGDSMRGYYAVLTDITPYVETQEALRESSRRLTAAVSAGNVGLWDWDLETNKVFYSKEWKRQIGYREHEIGDDFDEWQSRVHPDDLGPTVALVQSFIREARSSYQVEFRFRHKNGSYLWILVQASIIKDATGQPVRVLGSHVDITERKLAEAERERFMAAIEQAGEVIVITDPEGTIQYVNPAFEHTTGYSRDEVTGQNPRILKSGKHNRAFYASLWNTLAKGQTWEGRFVNKRKDGTLFTEEATISPVRGESGKIVNYVAVKRDITEQLRSNEERRRLTTQLHHAQRLESVGRLAGGVAHDLNNLLTPILGYGEILLDEFENDKVHQADVEKIIEAGKRARDLVRQLLAFSRKQVLEFKPIDLNHVLAGFEELLRRTIREDIEIQTIPASSVPPVMGDTGQLEQVIMNLAVNAQDAMPDGGILTIETAVVDLDEDYAAKREEVIPGPHVLLSISDTGHGMDEEIREHLFEPFFTTKDKDKGTGLGLATVYGIVKQHGGNIWVYSEPGKGATFKIYLPISADKYVENESGTRVLKHLEGSESILLVEDNEEVRHLAHTVLKRKGYTVLVAQTCAEALSFLNAHDGPIHLLLTDVVMPEMNGRDLFTLAEEKRPGIRVIYMSGYTDNVIAHRGVLDPGVDFIQKPFTIRGLLRKVREVLERGQVTKNLNI